MTNTTEQNDNKWTLNTQLHLLTLNERKNAIVLLYFLNTYEDDITAFKALKSIWIDNVYKLPDTSAATYNSIKNGRYNILSRMKRIHKNYMVELQPNEQ
jgi:hypothetical protein